MAEVVVPGSAMDFDFNSSRSYSPFLSTPSSPRRFGEHFYSAPTSPTRVSKFYKDFDEFLVMNDRYEREEREEIRPGAPKSSKVRAIREEDDFAFDVGKELERASLSAEELFDGGKIRPLKPPPRLQLGGKLDAYTTPNSPLLSPKSALSRGKKTILGAFSPRLKKEEEKTEHKRGRERTPALLSSNSGRRATRSLSPFRASESAWEEEEEEEENTRQLQVNSKTAFSSTTSSSSSSSKSSKKWSLKDFLLFRSASEGRATDRDPLQKYSPLYKKHEDKNSSIRSTESSRSATTSSRRGPVSAHELHYTKNKAVSDDLKKKTFLPYKQGLLGRLAFNPAVHALANGFGSLARS
jgi:hypothetical protein